MRVVVAHDKFAGTLTAPQTAHAIASGWRSSNGDDEIATAAMSDGGPGFLDVVRAALGGRFVGVDTEGPHGDPAAARVLIVDGDTSTAYVEAAGSCGIHLAGTPRRPLEATTRGLVPVLRAALAAATNRVVVGVGGTASTDGRRPVVEAMADWPADVELVVATDVEHPLLRPAGAARSFAPQKGARAEQVAVLEQRLERWAELTGGPKSARCWSGRWARIRPDGAWGSSRQRRRAGRGRDRS